MAKVTRDEKGLRVQAGGWPARPRGPTVFKEGDNPKTHHFGGTQIVGVGAPALYRGNYLEVWQLDEETYMKERRQL